MVGLGTVKTVHNEAPYVNAESLEKCHLSFNSHCSGYVFLGEKVLGIVSSCNFLLKLLALVHLIIYSAEQERINPQTLFLPSSIFLCLWLTLVCRVLEAQLISS